MVGVGGMAYYSAQASSESNDKNEDKYIELNAEKNSDDETTSILIKNNKNIFYKIAIKNKKKAP